MKEYLASAEQLIDLLGECTCQFTTTRKAIEILQENGFKELKLDFAWSIDNGSKYYINVYDSSVFAFSIGSEIEGYTGVRIATAHTDHPCLCVKPSPEMKKDKYGMVNVEMYGGLILNTWLDRPLSAAGKVTYKSDNCFEPGVKIFDLKKSLLTIPNLAIHQNRDVNKGIALNAQTDMAPLCTMIEEQLNNEEYFIKYIADTIGISKEDVLDFEIYIYNNDIPEIIGLNDEFISSPRLDNITSVKACIDGIISNTNSKNLSVIALYDNEEIGSRTKQGADSALLSIIIEKIYMSLGFGRDMYLSSITNGFLLSVDVAHGEHPNKLEKSDVTNKNPLNSGLVIKRACSQTYGTDSSAIAVIEQICKKNLVPYQKFASRSDVTTGSTLGALAGKYMPMKLVDVGVPILAMHSSRELMGTKDLRALEKLVEGFFKED